MLELHLQKHPRVEHNTCKSTHGVREQTHYDWFFVIIIIIIFIFRALKSICQSYIYFYFVQSVG